MIYVRFELHSVNRTAISDCISFHYLAK